MSMVDKTGFKVTETPFILNRLGVALFFVCLWVSMTIINKVSWWIIKKTDKIIRWIENY